MRKISHILLLGKVFLSIAAVCLMALSMAVLSACVNNGGENSNEVPGEYVDLGLASGTMWKSVNEVNLTDSDYASDSDHVFFAYVDAMECYGDKLPSWEQWMELINECSWTWTGVGCEVVGPNGKSIFLPAAGVCGGDGEVNDVGSFGDYWSSTRRSSPVAWGLLFNYGTVGMVGRFCHVGSSVRLVQGGRIVTLSHSGSSIGNIICGDVMSSNDSSSTCEYVDLGLPSSTKWKSRNEWGKYYTYDDAVKTFGGKLPTKEQFEELQHSCVWKWRGGGYKVIGPNGKSIFLPAAGFCNFCDSVECLGSSGDYWSSMPDGPYNAWDLIFGSGGVNLGSSGRDFGCSVRLVQD